MLKIVIVGAIPAIAMFVMPRRGAPLAPRMTMALGNFGLRLFHPPDASLMALIWHFGGVALLSVLAGVLGRRMRDWRSMSAVARPD